MYLENYVDKVVLLHINDDFVAANPAFFQRKAALFYARLRGLDELGIWIENPDWRTHPVGRSPEVHKLHFWIPWRAVVSIGAFPERVFTSDFGADEDAAGATAVGFKLREEEGR